MKILVVSDTHGDSKNLYTVAASHPEVKVIIHLGDGAGDVNKIESFFNHQTILQVCGNCDIGSALPVILEKTIAGKKILATHGHLFKVKKNLNTIVAEVLKKGVDIVFFGHTHKAVNIKQGTLHIINPGSLYGENGTYGIIDIDNDCIVGVIKKISDLKDQNIPL